VFKCLELIKDMSLMGGSTNVAGALAPSVLQSPVGVLDAACLSYKSDELTVGSCANSSHNSPDVRGGGNQTDHHLKWSSTHEM
jgi:cyclin D1/2/4, plant